MTFRKKNSAGTKAPSFVVPFIPFVGVSIPAIVPNIGIKTPLVGFARFYKGFTLIELIVVLTIAGILVAITVPNFSSFVNSNRLVSATNDLIGDLSLARSEALKRGTNAIVCKSGGGSTCTSSGSWDGGWIVFADVDDSNAWTASDVLIRSHERLAAGTTITASSDVVIYNRQGQIPTTGIGDYTFCNSATNKARIIKLNIVGRHTLSEASC